MSKSAVVQIAGKQLVVHEGDTITIDRQAAEPAEKITISDVLLVADGDKVTVGTPVVAKATVVCQVVDHSKGEKIRVATYKAKSRYRKVRGHRQALTTLKVLSIAA